MLASLLRCGWGHGPACRRTRVLPPIKLNTTNLKLIILHVGYLRRWLSKKLITVLLSRVVTRGIMYSNLLIPLWWRIASHTAEIGGYQSCQQRGTYKLLWPCTVELLLISCHFFILNRPLYKFKKSELFPQTADIKVSAYRNVLLQVSKTWPKVRFFCARV